jgi:hypothetical protein
MVKWPAQNAAPHWPWQELPSQWFGVTVYRNPLPLKAVKYFPVIYG